MQVPAQILKCVVFIGFPMADGEMRLAGTGFFLAETGKPKGFLVTARHVVEGVRALGVRRFFARMNTKDGNAAWGEIPDADWVFHPADKAVDAAVVHTAIPGVADHLAVAMDMCFSTGWERENDVGPGDEVFIAGLFRHHHGQKKNIPIIRVGNIAAMAEERIQTRDFGQMEAYLVEARSIGGLSGSPVFLNLGVARILRGEIKFSQAGPVFFLLGLVHGHYDVSATAIDVDSDAAGESRASVNTGIAIVTPISKVLEIIDHVAASRS